MRRPGSRGRPGWRLLAPLGQHLYLGIASLVAGQPVYFWEDYVSQGALLLAWHRTASWVV